MNHSTPHYHLNNETAERILEAAIKQFSSKGFSGSKTKEIAKEANVSEATIFRYFETKKDLLLALVSPAIVNSLTQILLESNGKSPEEIIHSFFKQNATQISNNLDLFKVIVFESLFHEELRETLLKDIVEKRVRLLRNFLDQQSMKGNFKEIDPQTASITLSGMLIGYMIRKHAFHEVSMDEESEDRIIREMTEIFLHGIEKGKKEKEEANPPS